MFLQGRVLKRPLHIKRLVFPKREKDVKEYTKTENHHHADIEADLRAPVNVKNVLHFMTHALGKRNDTFRFYGIGLIKENSS